jgi:hypothetical protein
LLYQIVAMATTMRMLAQQYERAHETDILVEAQRVTTPPYVSAPANA